MSIPAIIFGSATIGRNFASQDSVVELGDALESAGISRVDTAARYGGKTHRAETLIGDAGLTEKGVVIDTKINYFGDGSGTLSAAAIEKSLEGTLASLRVSKVSVLYCHAPDMATPLEEQAAAFDKQYKEGKFEELGVSNFPPSMVEEWLRISSEKGYIKPTVYQGQYNLICRSYEDTLFPLLRANNIKFNAFSPLAGGFLTGKLTPSTTPSALEGTRFAAGSAMGTFYRNWYDKPIWHDTIVKLRSLCDEHGVTMPEAALRWIMYHSALKAADGVIVGASRVSQVTSAMEQIRKGPLPEVLAKELGTLGESMKGDAAAIVSLEPTSQTVQNYLQKTQKEAKEMKI